MGSTKGILKSLILRALLGPPAFLLCVGLSIVNFLRPLTIGSLNAKGWISITVSYIEPYLRRLRMEGIRRPWGIVLNPGANPNAQLSQMYGRTVFLLDDRRPWLRSLFSHALEVSSRMGSPVVARWGAPEILKGYSREWREGNPTLRFTTEEVAAEQKLLESMGITGEVDQYFPLG